MPRPFSAATAEQVLAVSEAVVANAAPSNVNFVSNFSDLTQDQTSRALELACDLGLLEESQGNYKIGNPIARLLRTPQDQEKAAVLRVLLEVYDPFLVFREELQATSDAQAAATRTKTRLDLGAHREDVRTTLVGLATYSGALIAGQGGKYERDSKGLSNLLDELTAGCSEQSAALFRVREQLGEELSNNTSHENVLVPLAAALRHAAGSLGREAIVQAGNAVETSLVQYALRAQIDLSTAHGINAKIDHLALPSKLKFNGKYLGHLRNAADHGLDAEISNAWDITSDTGINYVFVALSFIKALTSFESGKYAL